MEISKNGHCECTESDTVCYSTNGTRERLQHGVFPLKVALLSRSVSNAEVRGVTADHSERAITQGTPQEKLLLLVS